MFLFKMFEIKINFHSKQQNERNKAKNKKS